MFSIGFRLVGGKANKSCILFQSREVQKKIIHKSTSDRIVLDSYYVSNKSRKIKSYALDIPKWLHVVRHNLHIIVELIILSTKQYYLCTRHRIGIDSHYVSNENYLIKTVELNHMHQIFQSGWKRKCLFI